MCKARSREYNARFEMVCSGRRRALRKNRLWLKTVCRLTIAASSLIITAQATLAQQAPPQPGPPPGATPKERSQDVQNREWRLRNMEREPVQAQVNQQRLREAIELVKQDFKRIQ